MCMGSQYKMYLMLWIVGKSICSTLICVCPCKQGSPTPVRLGNAYFCPPVSQTAVVLTATYTLFAMGQPLYKTMERSNPSYEVEYYLRFIGGEAETQLYHGPEVTQLAQRGHELNLGHPPPGVCAPAHPSRGRSSPRGK